MSGGMPPLEARVVFDVHKWFDPSAAFDGMKPGEWFRAPDGALQLACPQCGKISGLRCPPHVVAQEGRVLPSWVCPYTCGFHGLIGLRGLPTFRIAGGGHGPCWTCNHNHAGRPCDAGEKPCGCLASTPGGRPQPIYMMAPANALPIHMGLIRESELAPQASVMLGLGDTEVLAVVLPLDQAEELAKNLIGMIHQAKRESQLVQTGMPPIGRRQ